MPTSCLGTLAFSRTYLRDGEINLLAVYSSILKNFYLSLIVCSSFSFGLAYCTPICGETPFIIPPIEGGLVPIPIIDGMPLF